MKYKNYTIKIKLISNINPCHAGHKVGDEWTFDHNKTPAGMCGAAFNTLYPALLTLHSGGTIHGELGPDVLNVACPDPEVYNVFELKRIQKK